VSFLLMIVLTLVCLWDWDGSAPSWSPTPKVSMLLTAGVVFLIALHAFWISRRISRPLARDPSLRERLLGSYDKWRSAHQIGQYVLYGMVLSVLGWGWSVRQLWQWNTGGSMPGVELLILLPFLAGQVLTWIFLYDADRALHRAAHRVTDTEPFAQNWLDHRDGMPVPTENGTVAVAPQFGGRWTYVLFQLRQKLALVSIPVLLLILQKELIRLFPAGWQNWQSAINGAGFVILFGVFLGMPWLIRMMLGLKPLPPGVLRDRLEAAAKRLGVRCSDILLWNTRSGMANAMVIGLVPWLRYVVFTDRLVEEFPEDEIEAVFGHEVGHVRHHHMLFYLVFLMLSIGVIALTGEILKTKVDVWWPGVLPVERLALRMASQNNLEIFSVVTLVVGYIFLVFGFLSRRCERQADVFGCRAVSCGDPHCEGHSEPTVLAERGKALCTTGIQTFVRALEKVAHVNGISRDQPGFLQSWQHSTIARRVAFLRSVLVDRRAEAMFQRRLALGKWGLLVGLSAAFVALWLLRL
jgi:STE24 endopeptidase